MFPSHSKDTSRSSPQIEHSSARTVLVSTTVSNIRGRQEPQRPLRIDTMPLEIWADIFKRACASFLQLHNDPRIHGSPYPTRTATKPEEYYDSLLPSNPVLVISRVCVAWRDIIQSLPYMWSRVLLRESCMEEFVPAESSFMPAYARATHFPAIPISEMSIFTPQVVTPLVHQPCTSYYFPAKPYQLYQATPIPGSDAATALASSRTTRLHILSDHLRFSGTRPLHIVFLLPSSMFSESVKCPSKEFIDQVVSLLLQHHQRWGRIDIHDCEEGFVLKALNTSIPQHDITEFSLLDEITFSWEAEDSNGPWTQPPVQFPLLSKNVPKLHIASFQLRCPRSYSLPWSQLKCVTFTEVLYEELFEVLPYLTSITELSIHWGDDHSALDPEQWGQPSPEIGNFTLPSLEKFSIRGCMQELAWEHSCFRDAASFPNLRTLLLDVVRAEDLLSISAFLERSGCKLLEFSCTLYEGRSKHCAEALCMLLRSTPHLQALDALQYLPHGCKNSDDGGLATLLNFLLRRDGARIVNCPDLQRIRINPGCFTDSALLPTTVDMIEMRWATGRANALAMGGEVYSLQSVGCVDRYQWEYESDGGIRELYERLKSLRQEGLTVCFFEPQVAVPFVTRSGRVYF